MEISLDILSDQEIELYNKTIAIQGTIELKTQKIEDQEITTKYDEVHQKYYEIAVSTDDVTVMIEALKRLAFLNWFVQVEPSIYTGLGDLNRDVMFKSYSKINDLLQSGRFDKEFRWMLSYYSCWEWTILDVVGSEMPKLREFVKSVDINAFHVPDYSIRENTMIKRGQMGIYFLNHSYTNS